MPNTPITSTSQTLAVLQQQLADVVAAKAQAIGNLVAQETASNPGITFSRGGELGNESYDYGGYLANLQNQVERFTKLEITLLETIQKLQPYMVPQRLRI